MAGRHKQLQEPCHFRFGCKDRHKQEMDPPPLLGVLRLVPFGVGVICDQILYIIYVYNNGDTASLPPGLRCVPGSATSRLSMFSTPLLNKNIYIVWILATLAGLPCRALLHLCGGWWLPSEAQARVYVPATRVHFEPETMWTCTTYIPLMPGQRSALVAASYHTARQHTHFKYTDQSTRGRGSIPASTVPIFTVPTHLVNDLA